VGHLADQGEGGPARQAGVGIQTDDVLYARRRARQLAVDGDETRVGGSQQQPVELAQLAALSLPPHPAAFLGVPLALSMQQ
jgi:hypothetical protein